MKRKIRARVLLSACMVLFLALVCVSKVRAEAPLDAVDFVLNGSYSNDQWLAESDTGEEPEHWYRMVIPSDGLLELRIMSYCDGSLYFEFWNEDLSTRYKFSSCNDYVSAGSVDSPTTGTVTKVVSKGTYYFKLYGPTGRYKLWGQHTSYGTNDAGADSYDSPFTYSLGQKITGALTEMDTEDWYKITVPSSGEYTLTLMSYCNSSLDYKLYNRDLSSYLLSSYVSTASAATPVTKKEDKVLSAGTYYLYIYDSMGRYTMTFNKKAAVKKKNLKLSVTAKKGKKVITVKTTPYATVTVKYGSKKWKNYSSGASGKLKFRNSKKLKKGKKVVVTVKKSGYNTKKKTVKVK